MPGQRTVPEDPEHGAAVTSGQARLGAIVALALGVLGVYLSRRPTTDIAAGILAGAALLYFAASSVSASRKGGRARRRQEQARAHDRQARWEMYSHPAGEDYRDYEVGCRIELSSGTKRYSERKWRWFNDHPDAVNRMNAEGEAMAKAAEFNAAHWRP